MIDVIKQFRKDLHKFPELSGRESETSNRIKSFLEKNSKVEIITGIAGNGLAAVYDFSSNGPAVMIRCELDALPIEETNTFDHASVVSGVSHKCGHDGHMAIVAGLALNLSEQNFNKGKVILLFQPAEETGQGAHAIINDAKFKKLNPDYIFALHNLPGEPTNTVIIVEKSFSAAVQSVAVHLKGKESHASEPEKGINPAFAVAEIITNVSYLNMTDSSSPDFALATPIHLKMGDIAYGISPGTAELHYTLRAWNDDNLNDLKTKMNEILNDVCLQYNLKYTVDWLDYFPASVNDNLCNDYIENAARVTRNKIIHKHVPFKFGEDFGWYSKKYRSAMFGLGAGTESPALHHSDYDFPDELLQTGITLFTEIIRQVLNNKSDT